MTYIKNSCLFLFCVSSLWLNAQNAIISGNISTADEVPIANVTITVQSDDFTATTMTNAEGNYSFEDVTNIENITFTLEKDTDPLNGVSTLDYVLGAQHILGIEPFDTADKYLAMDVNKSGSVTVLDLVHLRRVILGLSEGFPNNQSWRFVDETQFASISFAQENTPEYDLNITYDFNLTSGQSTVINFVGIKVGDINGNANGN